MASYRTVNEAVVMYHLLLGSVTGALLAAPYPAVGAEPTSPARPGPASVPALATKIDRALESAWAKNNITPAAPASDAEFLRRVYLDLVGRVPSVAEARAFLEGSRADKRRALVAELLARPAYARHFAAVWRHLLLPEADTNFQVQFLAPGFEQWLQREFERNVPFDRMVRDVLTTPVDRDTTQQALRGDSVTSPVAFYLAKEAKPENLAAASARVFLGIRLECAQCHDHPFATWTRDQFWGLAAFFSGIRSQERGVGFAVPDKEILDRRELIVPGSERVVQAMFPDGTEPRWRFKVGARQTLAEWVTGGENPYFARAAVNRVWAYLFGVGLVEPVDELTGSPDAVAHHPELLDELAKAFVESGYDLKGLIEAITASRAYQLTSRGRAAAAPLFSRQQLRGLTAEQLFDSLAVATGQPDDLREDPRFGARNTPRTEFVMKFGQQSGRPVDHEMTIIQALTLMNGPFVTGATSPERSELLSAVLTAPFLTERGRIEAVYLAALARTPTANEMEKALALVAKAAAGGQKARRDEAVADIFWALLNSAEFLFNH
ncbi:DUF1549 and DUF1553 domain-containing protein [Gemmata sp. JC717]|uniref:DUF1549 and DUF1553 domain-containing protein n=1 Tax=Gemmata algarum TaxID=2975278 RepID=UPI0021BA6566|nr:DUF1549 and DUF1553 domain-containing protein [Gemmata algarum]MDY3552645.1 DUF1549 and DUF1553 domain-containing protein [Gemmata algarum]